MQLNRLLIHIELFFKGISWFEAIKFPLFGILSSFTQLRNSYTCLGEFFVKKTEEWYMISHALTIVINELKKHLADNYKVPEEEVKLGNLAELISNNSDINKRNILYISLVNIQEEKTLKNLPCHSPAASSLRIMYKNPPVFLNIFVLIAAAYSNYQNALMMLSRAICFFQAHIFFTQENVSPRSITHEAPLNDLDNLESFKLIFDLYSPSLEEVNHLWGALGGKQYPFVLYKVRMLELQFKATQKEGGLVEEVVNRYSHID